MAAMYLKCYLYYDCYMKSLKKFLRSYWLMISLFIVWTLTLLIIDYVSNDWDLATPIITLIVLVYQFIEISFRPRNAKVSPVIHLIFSFLAMILLFVLASLEAWKEPLGDYTFLLPAAVGIAQLINSLKLRENSRFLPNSQRLTKIALILLVLSVLGYVGFKASTFKSESDLVQADTELVSSNQDIDVTDDEGAGSTTSTIPSHSVVSNIEVEEEILYTNIFEAYDKSFTFEVPKGWRFDYYPKSQFAMAVGVDTFSDNQATIVQIRSAEAAFGAPSVSYVSMSVLGRDVFEANNRQTSSKVFKGYLKTQSGQAEVYVEELNANEMTPEDSVIYTYRYFFEDNVMEMVYMKPKSSRNLLATVEQMVSTLRIR